MNDDVAASMHRADEALRAATILVEEKLYADAISRAYYAAFSAAVALLASVGITAKTHDGAHTLLSKHFIRTGILRPETAQILSRIGADRETADYSHVAVFTEEMARKDLADATAFITAARAALDANKA